MSKAGLPVRLTQASAEVSTEPRMLASGEVVSNVLSTKQTHLYALNLLAGQYARVEILKGDLRLKVAVCAQPGHACFESLSTHYGSLDIFFAADVSAIHKLEITSLEGDTAIMTYELRVLEVGTATARQRLLFDAVRAAAGAEGLRENYEVASQLAALSKYSEAHRLWESAGESSRAAQTLCDMGDVYFALSQYPQASQHYLKSLALAERSGNLSARLTALSGIGYVQIYLGEYQKALSYARKMLDVIERADGGVRADAVYQRAEAQALNIMGEVHYSSGDLHKSIEALERALSIWTAIKERRGEALALLNLGYSHSDLGDLHNASEHFQKSLTLWQSVSDERGAALAQTALAATHSILGDEQLALSLHEQTVEFFRAMGNKQGEAAALNGVGSVYYDLNEYQAALDNYTAALRIYEAIGNRGSIALNKFIVGKVLHRKGEFARAETYYRESLALSREVGDQVTEAHALKGLAAGYFSKGDVHSALAQFNAALAIYRKLGNRRSQAYVLNDIGHIYGSSGDTKAALDRYRQALPLMRATSDRRGEALTLFNTARSTRDQGNLTAALSLIEDSIAISESLRTKIRNSQLRTSYFASVHQQYELYINVLMRLNTQHPNSGFARTALVASERARARSLLDSLLEEKINPKRGLATDFISQERELLRRLDEKAEYQTRLLAGKHTVEEAEQVAQDIYALTIQYQNVRSKLREQNPRDATLTQPDKLRPEDIQGIVKNGDTLLLEFVLGDEQSYLWVVSADEITSYELPGRSTIEGLARRIYELLTVRQSPIEKPAPEDAEKLRQSDAEYWQQAAALSKMLLGQVADRLGSKRLLIVSDGFLNYIPFEALPMPSSSATPVGAADSELLFFNHEVVGLPSALTLIALRSEKKPASLATKTIAVIADPVFDKDDPRILTAQSGNSELATGEDDGVYLSSALRDFSNQSDVSSVSRLPSTLREAKAIMAVTPPGEGVLATGFAATKEKIVSDGLRDYRIIHFATHGLLNSEQPELSGIILSLFDEGGHKRQGYLRLHDIYNLDLSTDLVVLSACRTGLGKNVQGEGVVGLSSGFMYSGAKSVVASLWKVDDDATAELMSHFYTAMLKEGRPPAEALKQAKLAMWKQERWRAPFYWAAFVLQGEYTENLKSAPHTRLTPMLIIGSALVLFVSCIYALTVRNRRRMRVA